MGHRQARITRHLMIALALAVACGVVWFTYRAKARHDAVAAIMRSGGSVRDDWQLPGRLGLGRARPGWARWLRRSGVGRYLGTIIWVDLLRGTDRDIEALASLPDVEHLNLTEATVTDAGLARLEYLDRLSWLSLNRCPVTDAGIAHIRRLTRLRSVDLNGTRITDAGLASLERLDRLDEVYVASTAITDAGLVHLEHLPRLRFVNLQGTAVTDAGVARLRRARPHLEILR